MTVGTPLQLIYDGEINKSLFIVLFSIPGVSQLSCPVSPDTRYHPKQPLHSPVWTGGCGGLHGNILADKYIFITARLFFVRPSWSNEISPCLASSPKSTHTVPPHRNVINDSQINHSSRVGWDACPKQQHKRWQHKALRK